MARSFADASSDKIATTLTTHGDQRTYSIWFYRTTGATGNSRFTRIMHKAATSARDEMIYWEDDDGVAPNNIIVYYRLFSTQEGAWRISNLGYYDAWHHLCITYDSTSTSNDAVIYLDGVSQTVTEDTAPTGTRVDNSEVMNIGNRADGARSWYGALAEFAAWDRILTADEIASLAKGYSPSFFTRSLVSYEPMLRDNINKKIAASTITGTTVSAHPRIIYPTNYQSRMVPVAAGGSIVLKTLDGLAQASIKTYQGLASASTKTWNGLSNV